MQWYLQFHADTSIRQEQVIGFLKHLLRHLPGENIVIWDRLNAHRGGLVRDWLVAHGRITVEYLPPYAPELNPNEYGWSHLKTNDLANYCPADVEELQARVIVAANAARSRQALLRGFFKAAGLPMRVK